MAERQMLEDKRARMARARKIIALLDSWEPLSDEEAMPEIEDYPPGPFDLDL